MRSPQQRADEIIDRWNSFDGERDTLILRAEMAALSVELGMIVKNFPEVQLKRRDEYENKAHTRPRGGP